MLFKKFANSPKAYAFFAVKSGKMGMTIAHADHPYMMKAHVNTSSVSHKKKTAPASKTASAAKPAGKAKKKG